MSMNTYTEPLARLAGELKPEKILEIGIGHDAFSSRVFLEHCAAEITNIDKGDWGGNSEKFVAEFGSRFKFINGRSEVEMPKLKEKYNLIFIDGDHAYEGCKSDILNAQKLLAPGGVILMDDYGVEHGAMDLDDNLGTVIGGMFGVKQACDECFTPDQWEEVYTEIGFANGAKAYKRKDEPKTKPR